MAMEKENQGTSSGFQPWADVRLAVAFLTRFPQPTFVDPRPLSASVWAFPVAGALVGLVGAGALYAAAWAQLHPLACALMGVAAMVLVSGALHEDGLADVADGFGASADKAKKLEVMRDSRVGTYGVLALVFSVGLRASVLAGLLGSGTAALAVVAAAIGSRAVMPMMMAVMPAVRADGLSHNAGRAGRRGAIVALVLGLGASAWLGFEVIGLGAAIGGVVGAVIGAVTVAAIAKHQIGGQTGDVLGAAAQAAELGLLIGWAGTKWTLS